MAHPAILRNLVEQYEVLQVLHAEQNSFETRRELEDVTYTLCVSTGTQTVEAALAVAGRQLDEQQVTDARAGTAVEQVGGADVRLTA
jgi:precorrin-2 methylase